MCNAPIQGHYLTPQMVCTWYFDEWGQGEPTPPLIPLLGEWGLLVAIVNLKKCWTLKP